MQYCVCAYFYIGLILQCPQHVLADVGEFNGSLCQFPR